MQFVSLWVCFASTPAVTQLLLTLMDKQVYTSNTPFLKMYLFNKNKATGMNNMGTFQKADSSKIVRNNNEKDVNLVPKIVNNTLG